MSKKAGGNKAFKSGRRKARRYSYEKALKYDKNMIRVDGGTGKKHGSKYAKKKAGKE